MIAPRVFGTALIVAGMVIAIPCASSADPIVLRGPTPARSMDVAFGGPDLAIGGWLTPSLGVALEWRLASSLGASAGIRRTLAGGDVGFGIDGFAAAGASWLRFGPGLALTTTLSARARYRTQSAYAAFGLASASALQVAPTIQVRLPLMAEVWLAFRVGSAWIGAQAGAGIAYVPRLAPSLELQLALYAAVDLGR